ncbi:protoporphyrinogen/coproporphyrinogen oxidase [Aureispira anguillae]|uniref:FAD-dependent oxidoreductase n=1 Tax=Aureispira anguillae TaxID=2864201 RepID=A0A916DRR5_9BACT|nr:FAD-dependent oxidoreductase [Aureispira anguillae]BDS10361.1 FAD-dependent oxidoreductase [Aureispira anguillae]
MSNKEIAILGGGPAGLALGYYAQKKNYAFTIYEGQEKTGGNCRTFQYEDFLFDAGAHRIHDKSAEVTQLIKDLMQGELKQIHSPSQIYKDGKFIDFPLTPLNLVSKLGLPTFVKAAAEIALENLKTRTGEDNFERLALKAYGKKIAENFLLNYSQKLWGTPCHQLSTQVAGKRLKGLNVKTFIIEGLLGLKAKTEHIDGAFYYPDYGIGSIFDRLAERCDLNNILTNHKVTKIYHQDQKITKIELNHQSIKTVDCLLNTLPLNVFLNSLSPRPPAEILDLIQQIRFRSILLVVFMIDKPSINNNASMYFPDEEFPFTRIYEPKNRSAKMAPSNKTTLAVEIPCQHNDYWWKLGEEELIEEIKGKVLPLGFFKEDELLNVVVKRLPFAYPILEIGFEEKIATILDYLKGFKNLYTNGRNGLFKYSHIHDMFLTGKATIESIE